MELTAEKFVDRLLSKEAEEQPCDSVQPEELVLELPKDFDEEKFNKGREFYHQNSFTLTGSMLLGLVAVFAVDSILRVLKGTHRSNSVFTAYRRYVSTMLHTVTWFEHDLKPGSESWKSLSTVRSRHLRGSLSSKARGVGIVSQRDIAITQFGFIGFTVLKPDDFGIRQTRPGDWDAYMYTWKVLGHMIGLEDKYNLCRSDFYETREVCQEILERVFTPSLENVPEYFEHMSRVMLEGMALVNPSVDTDALLYLTRWLADVPGYVFTENDRIKFQLKLKKHLNGRPIDTGVDTAELMRKSEIGGLPDLPPRLLYYKDFDTLETVPAYKALRLKSKFKLYLIKLYNFIYTSAIGRWYLNANFKFALFLIRYFPFKAFFKFGVGKSLVNIFKEDPTDTTVCKPNADYLKPAEPETWWQATWSIIW